VAFLRGVRDIGFYLLFFPQLVAGPIVKAKEFWPQIRSKRLAEIDWITVRRALILGYFLKIFVADNLSEQTKTLTQGTDFLLSSRAGDLLPLLYCYSLQIFADFAGYSLIAIGLAALFGYRFPINFNFPYLSQSITEFWRRWHMSLSSWLRDYLYIPLGGNRKGELCTFRNLFLVMFLGGLWHGAEWKFALWGSLHGVFLAVERLLSKLRDKNSASSTSGVLVRSWAFVRAVLTFHLVTILWLAFLMPDMVSIVSFFKGVASSKSGFSGPPVFSLLFYGSAVVAYHGWGWLKEHAPRVSNSLLQSSLEPALHGLMLFLIVTNPGAPSGFIYFQF
jgi:alginate O-acetyltransferase complex protein AlgI